MRHTKCPVQLVDAPRRDRKRRRAYSPSAVRRYAVIRLRCAGSIFAAVCSSGPPNAVTSAGLAGQPVFWPAGSALEPAIFWASQPSSQTTLVRSVVWRPQRHPSLGLRESGWTTPCEGRRTRAAWSIPGRSVAGMSNLRMDIW